MTEKVTADSKRALRMRDRVKGKKPEFARPESWRYVRLKRNWRRPKGLDHKVRIQYKGWPPAVGVGYRGPRAARGLHPSGYVETLVFSLNDLTGVDPKIQAIRIAHTVGKRKRARIITEARRKRICILNVKEIKEAKAPEEEKAEEEKEETKELGEEKTKAEGPVKEAETGKEAGAEEPEEKLGKPKRRKRRANKQ